ncbi:MAG TPA: hypothetical protein VK453_23195 [Micromonosporaceae bacterium]|nr:hypothetical protein [Micromonosporaceae bacterium]
MRLRRPSAAPIAAVLTALLLLPACGQSTGRARWVDAGAAGGAAGDGTSAPASPGPAGAGAPGTAAPKAPPGAAPARAYPVGVRQLALSRGAQRPLSTTVWYPATGRAGSGAPNVVADAAPAAGRFPVVLFSHGLTGYPEAYEGFTSRLAAAGFVVAAPAYPFTKRGAPSFNPVDVLNQPADAWHVIGEVLKLDTRTGDPLAGHLDQDRVGAAGHSAGGYTTAGMLSARRGAPLAAAVIIAGGAVGGFGGPSTPALFIHGDRDPTVEYANGRAAYDALPWPKAFLTLANGGHWEFLAPGAVGFDATTRTATDFLRWSLYGDAAAKGRVARDGGAGARVEAALG